MYDVFNVHNLYYMLVIDNKTDPGYPRDVSQTFRGGIIIYLGLALCVDTYYRALIIDYLKSIYLKNHPVNAFSWISLIVDTIFGFKFLIWILASTRTGFL